MVDGHIISTEIKNSRMTRIKLWFLGVSIVFPILAESVCEGGDDFIFTPSGSGGTHRLSCLGVEFERS
jgi:hypothetical protein